MLRITYAVTLFLFLAAAITGVSGCAAIEVQSPSQDVTAFFVAGKEAHYLALNCPTSGSVDLSAYSHLMETKYPPTLQVEVLSKAPSRPYKSFAVLECKPASQSQPEAAMEDLKSKAREIGADAIILCQAGPGPGLPGIAPNGKMQAVAIRYVLTSTSDKDRRS